jgi:transaldolase
VIATLLDAGIPLNITAICDSNQVLPLVSLFGRVPVIVSVFAGRIADTGRDATQHIAAVRHMLWGAPKTEILWASTRQVYNIVEAELNGADIITMTPDLVGKLVLRGKSLSAMTVDTVKQFAADAKAAGLEVA